MGFESSKIDSQQHSRNIKRERVCDTATHTHIYCKNMSMNYINIKSKKRRSE